MEVLNRTPLIKITKIPFLNIIVVKQSNGEFFVTTKNSLVIDVAGLSIILRFLVLNNMLDYNILERILDEYRSKTN
jgi:hypothetical protein